MMAESGEKLKNDLTILLAERAKGDTLNASSTLGSLTGSFSYDDSVPQYDIGRSRVTEFNPKATKDTYYRFDDDRSKRFGTTNKPVSYDVVCSNIIFNTITNFLL